MSLLTVLLLLALVLLLLLLVAVAVAAVAAVVAAVAVAVAAVVDAAIAVVVTEEEVGADMTTVSSTGITMLSRLTTTANNKQTNNRISRIISMVSLESDYSQINRSVVIVRV